MPESRSTCEVTAFASFGNAHPCARAASRLGRLTNGDVILIGLVMSAAGALLLNSLLSSQGELKKEQFVGQ